MKVLMSIMQKCITNLIEDNEVEVLEVISCNYQDNYYGDRTCRLQK